MSVEQKKTIAGRGDAVAGRAAARLSKALEVALGATKLSLPQYRLLLFLSGGSERATALAGWLDVSPPSLTALVDGAVARGLVERVALEEDRRCVRHQITPLGHHALAEADVALAAKLAAITANLEPADAERALEGLRLVGRAMDIGRAKQEAEKETAGATS